MKKWWVKKIEWRMNLTCKNERGIAYIRNKIKRLNEVKWVKWMNLIKVKINLKRMIKNGKGNLGKIKKENLKLRIVS